MKTWLPEETLKGLAKLKRSDGRRFGCIFVP
jgi:hypothetical protein